ncbi:hypothetical protein [Deinococcus sp.]|uniref:hypothetical protein n=1 Tax=Deinococcus sp. TaxID=47478 RepID=UPI0025E61E21|nr:hypothetical protein [Deinococcus sp.]
MLYDIHDTDDGADLLLSSVSAAVAPPGPRPLATPLAWLGDADLSGAVVPGALPGDMPSEMPSEMQRSGAYEFRFRNGYGALVTVRGAEFSVSLKGDWLPGQDREEVFGMGRDEVTTFLRSVEALPAPDLSDLGEF